MTTKPERTFDAVVYAWRSINGSDPPLAIRPDRWNLSGLARKPPRWWNVNPEKLWKRPT